MIPPRDAHTLARLLVGHELNGELANVSDPLRPLAVHMVDLPAASRPVAMDGFLCGRPDRDDLIMQLAAIDPDGPPPEDGTAVRFATLADLRQAGEAERWCWKGFIPASGLAGIAAYEGVGKTRFAMDLARRIWFAEPLPDGQNSPFPAGTRTLWICADGQHDELDMIAKSFGMPPEAVVFNAPAEEPYGGTELDSPEDRERLRLAITMVRPGVVFVDSLTNATGFNLCSAAEVKALMTPLRDIAKALQVPIIPLLHLSKEGQALGRRVKGLTRVLMHLECPDPKHSGQLKLWVEKSFAIKPPPMGVLMGEGGNTYDHVPPEPPPKPIRPAGKPGRPSTKRDEAREFVMGLLKAENDRLYNAVCQAWLDAQKGSWDTIARAINLMIESGDVVKDGGTGTGRQLTLHLVKVEADRDGEEGERGDEE